MLFLIRDKIVSYMLGKDIKQNGLDHGFPLAAWGLWVSEGGKGDVFANHKFTP